MIYIISILSILVIISFTINIRFYARSFKETKTEFLKFDLFKEDFSVFERNFSEYIERERDKSRIVLDELKQVSHETQNLCNTLRGKAKVQGTWGEEMLSRILETAGLVKGVHYEEQYKVIGENGKKLYPDVVVHLSGGRNIVVDSKVSLEQFIKANEAENHNEQKQALKYHVVSMKTHVGELVQKNYQNLVENSLEYILMFVPHEGAFQAAVQEDESLLTWAYQQKVIIVNPSNIMTILLIVKNIWQQEERVKDIEKIKSSAVKLYGKFVSFAKNFEKMDQQLFKLRQSYDAAKGQLCTGSNNIIKQLTTWEDQYGIRTNETIPESLK